VNYGYISLSFLNIHKVALSLPCGNDIAPGIPDCTDPLYHYATQTCRPSILWNIKPIYKYLINPCYPTEITACLINPFYLTEITMCLSTPFPLTETTVYLNYITYLSYTETLITQIRQSRLQDISTINISAQKIC